LWHPPGKETRGALTKEISHEEKSSLVQSLEQPDVICWEPTKFHDMEDCSVVHGVQVEGIFDIKEKHDRETFGSALSC
jgi:hypothetical protein